MEEDHQVTVAAAGKEIEGHPLVLTVRQVEEALKFLPAPLAFHVVQRVDVMAFGMAIPKHVVGLIGSGHGSPSLEHHDAAHRLALLHEVEALVHLMELQPVRDLPVEVDLAFHEAVDQPG